MAIFGKNKEQKQNKQNIAEQSAANFAKLKSALKEMYDKDENIRYNVNKTSSSASSIGTVNYDSLQSVYYNVNSLDTPRQYSNELYAMEPVYAGLIDFLANLYMWKYTFVPRQIREKVSGEYSEVYELMGEVVEGLSIETTFPMVLTNLLINGSVYLVSIKTAASKTITTITLPQKYCRVNAITQFGTYTYQFDFSYFDSLGVTKEQLEILWPFYPPEMKTQYEQYLKDKQNMRWQMLDPKFAAALQLNKYGFPTKLKAFFGILQYKDYLQNELKKSNQQITKYISHEIPTWEDRLIIDIDEMKELHQSISKAISPNKDLKLITTYGKMNIMSVGNDDSKENKVLANAYAAIYNNNGENDTLFNGDSVEALKCALERDELIMWRHIESLMSYYNIVVNNSYSFKGYQCDITMLPITWHNRLDQINIYKEGATLGTSRLEYMVATGTKQVNISSKIDLEDYLHLDKLKPLSTSYTQVDNSAAEPGSNDTSIKEEDDDTNKKQEQEVAVEDETNTK